MKVEEEYIKHINKFMPCPVVALEILKIAHDDDCNINKLSLNIEKDPALTANMLKMANSAYFGHMKQIQSITDIIVRLGMESIKLIAITSASSGLLDSKQKAYNLEHGGLWRHSYATAILASIICQHAGEEDTSGVYTAALLHDIGKVVLNKHLLKVMPDSNEPETEKNVIDHERSLLKTDHAKVGEALLVKWGLPETITKPVGDHHNPENDNNEFISSRIIRLANIITAQMELAQPESTNLQEMIMEFLLNNQDLPDVPNFVAKKEKIIDEFFNKYNEIETISFNMNE